MVTTLSFSKFIGITATVISCLLTGFSCYANEIDSLKTDRQVLDFLEHFYKNIAEDLVFRKYSGQNVQIADSLHIHRWVKTDIDNNGETDLLVFGRVSVPGIVVILLVNGKYKLVETDYSCHLETIYPVIEHVGNENLLLWYWKPFSAVDSGYKKGDIVWPSCDTLVFKKKQFY